MEECDETREQQLVEVGQWGRLGQYAPADQDGQDGHADLHCRDEYCCHADLHRHGNLHCHADCHECVGFGGSGNR